MARPEVERTKYQEQGLELWKVSLRISLFQWCVRFEQKICWVHAKYNTVEAKRKLRVMQGAEKSSKSDVRRDLCQTAFFHHVFIHFCWRRSRKKLWPSFYYLYMCRVSSFLMSLIWKSSLSLSLVIMAKFLLDVFEASRAVVVVLLSVLYLAVALNSGVTRSFPSPFPQRDFLKVETLNVTVISRILRRGDDPKKADKKCSSRPKYYCCIKKTTDCWLF